jgi:hypothetical protein
VKPVKKIGANVVLAPNIRVFRGYACRVARMRHWMWYFIYSLAEQQGTRNEARALFCGCSCCVFCLSFLLKKKECLAGFGWVCLIFCFGLG